MLVRRQKDAVHQIPRCDTRAMSTSRPHHVSTETEQVEASASRRAAIDETRGALPGVYAEHYLEELRREWPTYSFSNRAT